MRAGGGRTRGGVGDSGVRRWAAPALGRPTPVAAGTLQGAVELASGADFTCARTADGAVWCWGEDQDGQLGDGADIGRADPAPVSGITGVSRIIAGGDHACAVTNGALMCWG